MRYKIIFIAVIILSFCKNVYAETFYGKYRRVNDVGNYKEDEIMKDTYKLYNTYKIEYIDLGYIEDNNNYIKDEKDYIEEVVEVYDDEESDEYIEIITPTPNTFQFIFYNIPSKTIINELEVYNKENKDNYSIYNRHMLGSTINNMNDGDYNTSFKQIYDKKYISLVLKNRYNIENIKVILYTEECNDIDIEILVGDKRVPITLTNNIKRKHLITFKHDETLVENQVNYKNKTIKKLYRHYKENIIKLDNYVKSGDNLLLNDYLEVNDVYIRDKLILKDNLVITDKNTKVLDLIEYSTDNVNINCNIDYEVNGIYSCDFILNDINITKNIEVNIPKEEVIITEEVEESIENTIEEKNIEEIEVEDNILNEEIIEKQIVNNNTNESQNNVNKVNNINKKENNISNITTKKSSTTTTKKTTTTKTTKKIVTTKIVKSKNDSKENVNKEKDKKILNIVKFVIFFNLIVIEIILFIKKRKRNNVERV